MYRDMAVIFVVVCDGKIYVFGEQQLTIVR